MKKLMIVLLAGTMSLGAGAAMAKNNGNGQGNGHGNAQGNQPVKHDNTSQKYVQPQYVSSCPPGLAKKNPPCVPPGQAKKYGHGDRLPDYVRIQNPDRYGLRNGYYVTSGNYVYRIDQNTREVLNLIGAVSDILN